MCRWVRNTYLEREAGTFLLRVDSIEIFHKVAAVINIYFTTFLRKSARIIPLVTKARRQSPYLMMAWSWILFGWGKCVSALHTEKNCLDECTRLTRVSEKKVVPFLLLQMIQNRLNLNPRRHLFLPKLFTLHLSSDYWISDYKQHSVNNTKTDICWPLDRRIAGSNPCRGWILRAGHQCDAENSATAVDDVICTL